MCRPLGKIIFLCLGLKYVLYFFPEISVSWGFFLFCLAFFFPQENGMSEEKEQEEENLCILCLEPNGSMFMLNSLCSEICFTAMLSAFCLCGLSSER